MSTTTQRVADFFDGKAQSFDSIYSGEKSLPGRIWDRLTRRNIADRFQFTIRMLEPLTGKSLLDVGCGSGRYCAEFARLGASKVVGIDVSRQMLILARQLTVRAGVVSRCNFIQIDIANFAADEPFDAVVAMGFFDYVECPLQVLRRLRPLTRGLLLAAFPARWALRAPLRKVYLNLRGAPVYFFNEVEIRELLERADFRCVSLQRSGPIYLLVAEPNHRS